MYRLPSRPMKTERDMCCAAECRTLLINYTMYIRLDSVRNVFLKHESAVNTTMRRHVIANTLGRI